MFRLKGAQVRELLEQQGESVRSFASKHNIPQSTMQAWILGRRNIKLEQLEMLAAALRANMLTLYDVVPRKRGTLSRTDEDIRTIRELFLTMTDDQRTKVISVALALLDGANIGDDL